jgi:hypothetical protein
MMTPGPIMLQTASWPPWARYAFATILLVGGLAGMWIHRPDWRQIWNKLKMYARAFK